jgi:predicted transcriptional regulator
MNKFLEQAIEKAWQASPEQQNEIAHAILEIVDDEVYVLSDEESAAIDEALAEVERGELASEEEVATIFAQYRR